MRINTNKAISEMIDPYNIKWLDAVKTILQNNMGKKTFSCDDVFCTKCPFSSFNNKYGNVCLLPYDDVDNVSILELFNYKCKISKSIIVTRLDI